MPRNHKSLWPPLIWITCRAHIVLNLLWHCNLPIIWLTDSDWLCIALSFLLLQPCPSVKAYQLSFGLAVYFGWLYKLNGCFMHADRWPCLSGLFLHFIHLWKPGECYRHTFMSTWEESIPVFFIHVIKWFKIKYLQHTFLLNKVGLKSSLWSWKHDWANSKGHED